jgi:LEA14-like dessication related protein
MMRRGTSRLRLIALAALLATGLLGCAALEEFTNVRKPTVTVEGVRYSDLSFESLAVVLDTSIKNPNSAAVSLAGFDYDLGISGRSVVTGDQSASLSIPANGEGKLAVPVTLRFKELYRLMPELKGKGRIPYRLATGLSFNLPVLGKTRVPLVKEGSVPLLKVPDFRVGPLSLKELSFSGAEAELRIGIRNNNGFDLLMEKMTYELQVNGQRWAEGRIPEQVLIQQDRYVALDIPVSVDFRQLGETAYRVLLGGKELEYRLTGDLELKPGDPDLGDLTFPLDKSGSVKVRK